MFIKRGDGKILGVVDPEKLDDKQKESLEEKVATELSNKKSQDKKND